MKIRRVETHLVHADGYATANSGFSQFFRKRLITQAIYVFFLSVSMNVHSLMVLWN
jgi:hypothetical protein